jgi:tripartite-type tricarboxylate transporter receptor subunit TctC
VKYEALRCLSIALLASLAYINPAAAQNWPAKPIKLFVNFPPGGAADVLARALAPSLGEALKQPIVIENKSGAGGNLGAEAVAHAPPDGYTLLMSSGGAITINPLIYSKMSFDPEKDLTPVAAVARVLVYLVTHPSVPSNNVQEFIAHAKANPGKLSYGSPGPGSSPHLAGEMFNKQANINTVHVPYRGAAPALTDLLAGQVQFMFDPGPGLRQVSDGKLKLLAVGSPKRAAQYPNTPTVSESGMPGFDADTFFGVYAPAGTPAPTLKQLHAEINKALQSPKVLEVIKGIGAEPAAMSRDEFIATQRKDRERFGPLIKEIGLKVE